MMNFEPINLTDAEFTRIRAMAKRLAGITIAPTKKALITGRWGRRLAHHGCKSYAEYLEFLSSVQAGDELQTSLDLLTTNETNFFREPKHFDFLRTEVLPKSKRGATFRVWSAACSSGEEPYSVAMLLAAELTDGNWEVLGTDISGRVLATAKAGLYDMERGKPIPPDYLQRFCLKGTGPQAGKFMIDRPLRDRVKFARANLNEPLPDFGQFDVILLRNVMIYFDADTKSKVVSHLVPALRSGGHFIIGHCDTLTGVPHALTACSASVYRKPQK
jgi:chemotaxis protein methyltransferase CheR